MDIIDHDLDINMAHLEINEKKRRVSGSLKYKLNIDQSPTSSKESDTNTTGVRRSGRKRIRPLENEKRRVLTKPKKLLDTTDIKEISNYYLDKRVKRLPPSLETIFEEPKGDSVMSSRKFRRCLQFPDLTARKDKLKIKKRSLKAKKICVIKRLSRKVAMDLLEEKLLAIEKECTDSDERDSE